MKELQELLAQQMTRKEFMKLLAVALLSMLGVNNFISMLNKRAAQTSGKAAMEKASHGFGSRKFGA